MKDLLTLTERIANVELENPIRISNFQTLYELAILFISMV